MSLNTRPAVRRCPSCGSRLAGAARRCDICGSVVPWRYTLSGTLVESVLAVALGTLVIAGLWWLRREGAAPISPREDAVARLVTALPTDVPTFTPASPISATLAAPIPLAGSITAEAGAEATATVAATAAPEVLVYVIQGGDSLSKIAGEHDVAIDDLLAANPGMTTDSFLGIGDELRVPRPRPAGAEAQPSGAGSGGGGAGEPTADATVAAGDHAVTGAPETATPGDTVPPSVAGDGAVVTRPAEAYRVQDGDSLQGIATAYGVSVDDLVAWNELPDASAVIQVGQEIIVRPAAMVTATPAGNGRSIAAVAGDLERSPQVDDAGSARFAFTAPDLLAPGADRVVADETPYLRWASVGVLPAGAYYLVLLREVPADEVESGAVAPPRDMTEVRREWIFSNATALRVPANFRPAFGTTRVLQWAVEVRHRRPGLIGDDPGEPASPTSEWRTFTWSPG